MANNRMRLDTPLSVSGRDIAAVRELQMQQEWLEYGKYLIAGCYSYFHTTIINRLSQHRLLYKAARLCHPLRMADLRFSMADVREVLTDPTLLDFAPCFGAFCVDGLGTELPAYKAAVVELGAGEPKFEMADIMPFWRRHRDDLPQWCALARVCATIQPSSAAVERAFSILDNSFGDKQAHALEDYKAASCMLQYNGRES